MLFLATAIPFHVTTWPMRRCEFAALERKDFSRVTVRYPEDLARMQKLADYRTCRSVCKSLVHNHRLMAGLSDYEITKVLSRFKFRSFDAGEMICEAGQICDAWLFLGIGKAERCKEPPGSPKYVGSLGSCSHARLSTSIRRSRSPAPAPHTLCNSV